MMKGAVAAGHPATAEAAAVLLREGGNAFDAVLAAMCAAAVAEPVLTSLGGGGFLLARPAQGKASLLDFFVQTPKVKRPRNELDFYPIIADFGTTQQEFHIGLGSVATPGCIHGLFAAHEALGRAPLREVVQPAIELARQGVQLNALQSYIFSIVQPIYVATAGARAVFGAGDDPNRLPGEGELTRNPDLADSLELLVSEGEDLFRRGEIGQSLTKLCAEQGGQLGMDDLQGFQLLRRQPLRRSYRGAEILTNPLPSAGGVLIAFALSLLESAKAGELARGGVEHLALLAAVMEQTSLARGRVGVNQSLLDPALLAEFERALQAHPLCSRGTTHISAIDAEGNAASLTLSNGEGCGVVLPGTGIMLNNMLGEEDLNPGGFHRWHPDTRVASMMAPTVLRDGERLLSLGSGGSNRLRTAILQVISYMLDFGLTSAQAVAAPRLHLERGGRLDLEPGFAEPAYRVLGEHYQDHCFWQVQNLFFGGVHTVCFDGQGFDGAGDPRRGGVFLSV